MTSHVAKFFAASGSICNAIDGDKIETLAAELTAVRDRGGGCSS